MISISEAICCLAYLYSNNSHFRFKWDLKKFRPDFSIYPVEGCITPGMDVTFEVIFEPKEAVADIRYDVRLAVQHCSSKVHYCTVSLYLI